MPIGNSNRSGITPTTSNFSPLNVSNLPIIFYVVFFSFTESIDGGVVPFWLMVAGFGMALVLRFEFMNTGFTRVVKFLELGALGTMLYLSSTMLIRF